MLADVADELVAKGLAWVSDGALCAFPAGFENRDGTPLPLIIRKSDGGYNYATTDLATIRFRVEKLHADRALYVVGTDQALHFKMVFAVAREAGWLPDRPTSSTPRSAWCRARTAAGCGPGRATTSR